MRTIDLPDGRGLPVMGLGTWRMGEAGSDTKAEVRVIQKALDVGISLLDTAEIYANGGSERVVGEAIRGRRDSAFIVSKVAPSHASRRGTVSACEASLSRLGIETLDLYLLHWRGSVAPSETVEAFETLKAQGKIRAWGVSNFDVEDMAALVPGCAANQVLYNPQSRGIEFNLLPWCERAGIPIMAYTPLGQHGVVLNSPAIKRVAGRHGATPGQVALAWGLRQPGVVSIPKTGNPARVEVNLGALEIRLTAEDLAEIDAAFPPPRKAVPLEML